MTTKMTNRFPTDLFPSEPVAKPAPLRDIFFAQKRESSSPSTASSQFGAYTSTIVELHNLQENIRVLHQAPLGDGPRNLSMTWKLYERTRKESIYLCKQLSEQLKNGFLDESVNTGRTSSSQHSNLRQKAMETGATAAWRKYKRSMDTSSTTGSSRFDTTDTWSSYSGTTYNDLTDSDSKITIYSAITEIRSIQEGIVECFQKILLEIYRVQEPELHAQQKENFLNSLPFREYLVSKWERNIWPPTDDKLLFWKDFKIQSINFEEIKSDLRQITKLLKNPDNFTRDDICEYVISSNGDTILEFEDRGSPRFQILRFRVSSRRLAESSPYFSQILRSPLLNKTGLLDPFENIATELPEPPEKHIETDGKEVLVYRMTQNESNKCESLSTLFHAAHSHMLPRKMNLSSLISIAEVCLRYQCASPVEYFVEKHWIPQLVNLADKETDAREALFFVSFVFGLESLFTRLSRPIILESTHEHEILKTALWPQYLKNRIIFAREDSFSRIYACCESAMKVFLPATEESVRLSSSSVESRVLATTSRCAKGSHACDAINLGWLMMVFNVLGLLPSLEYRIGGPNSPSGSLKITIEQLTTFPSPTGLHDQLCDYAPVFRRTIKSILSDLSYLTLNDIRGKGGGAFSRHTFLGGGLQKQGSGQNEEQSPPHTSNMMAPIINTSSGSSEKRRGPGSSTTADDAQYKSDSVSPSTVPTKLAGKKPEKNLLLDGDASHKHRLGLFEKDITPESLHETLSIGKIEWIQTLLEENFESVAKGGFIWLSELRELGYGTMEISQLLLSEKNDSPWIYFEPKDIPSIRILDGHHQQLCVHAGGQDTIVDADTRLTSAGRHWSSSIPSDEEMARLEELCGLAGVVPNSRDVDKWLGSVKFSQENDIMTASVSSRPNFVGNIFSDPKGTFGQLCSNTLKILSNLCTAIGYAQRSGMCCNSFTILLLKHAFSEKGAIEILKVRVEVISKLLLSLDALTKLYRAGNESLEIKDLELEVINCSENVLQHELQSGRSSTLPQEIRMLDICTLTTQILCLGFASYIKAHIGAMQLFFLDTPVENVKLFGRGALNTGTAPITASLFRLTCIDNMIQSPVLVFHEADNQTLTNEQQRYDLLASPVDLVDTWGPGQFSTEEAEPVLDNLTCVLIGGGVIQPTANDRNLLHWSRGVEPNHNHSVTFSSTQKYLIGGGVVVNRTCQASRKERWSSFLGSLQNLGTSPDYWKATENEAGFSLLGQQFVGAQLQFNKTWTWHPGNSWKTQYLSLLDELPFTELDRPWGLQVSCCTGVSRRVPLRVLLANVMPTFAKNLAISPGWATLHQRGIIEALELGGDEFKKWYDDLACLTNSQELQALAKRLIRHILLILRDTGIDRGHKNFLIACPQDHMAGKPISMCLPVPCENASLWAKILTDSEQCATFACMTTLCFESQEHKCQKTNPWHCPSLDTAVQQLRAPNEPIFISPNAWNLNVNTKYWIGTPDSGLQAKVVRSAGSPFTRLEISESAVPKRTRARLGAMSGLLPKMEHLRERQVDTWPAEDVLVVSSPR